LSKKRTKRGKLRLLKRCCVDANRLYVVAEFVERGLPEFLRER
jgi:hypothetical protein